jgi:hypothetical protein
MSVLPTCLEETSGVTNAWNPTYVWEQGISP